jgi:excisionase family DNA binding protein
MSQVDSPIEKLAFAPAEAAQALGISRSRLYELLYEGTIPSIKLGSRRLIRRETLVAYLDQLESGSFDAS